MHENSYETADGIPVLSQQQLQHLLERLSLPSSALNLTYLTQLQWAYLCHSVFHNLYLLAGYAGYAAPLTAKDSLNSVLANQGGPCHVQTVGFYNNIFNHENSDLDKGK